MWPDNPPRVLFNADPNFLFANLFPPDDASRPFEVGILKRYVTMLAKNGVEAMLICPNAQVPWYPSKKLDSMTAGYTRGDLTFFYSHFPPLAEDFTPQIRDRVAARLARMLDRYLDLQDAGIDWLTEMVRTCEEVGISPWLSVRMNDAHGGGNWDGSFMNPPMLRSTATRLSGARGDQPDARDHGYQLMNFAHEPVRDYMLKMIEELLESYAFQGVELDWIRTAHCCQPPASEADTKNMTAFHGRVRAMADEHRRAASGKSIPVGLRLPARVRVMRSVGIDAFEIAKQGHIDFIGQSNFWQTTWDADIDQLKRDLPPEMAVVGIIEGAPNWVQGQTESGDKKGVRMLPASPPLLRGNAAGKLALGADTIETYNFFCSDEPMVRNPDPTKRQGRYDMLGELGSLETLRGKPKHYAIASMDGGYMYPFFEQAEQLPAILPAGHRKAFRLSMASEPADAKLSLTLQLVFKEADVEKAQGHIGASFNGQWTQWDFSPTRKLLTPAGIYTHHLPEHIAFNCTLPVQAIEHGWNEVVVFNTTQDQTLELVSVELALG